eukprot:1878102-Pleurochrysis_carterae.AAC.1
MPKVSPPADLIPLPMETVHVCMNIGVNSLMLPPALSRRSEGEARQHAHARSHSVPHASVHVECNRDATRSSFQQALEFWQQLETKAQVPLANPPNEKPGPTA